MTDESSTSLDSDKSIVTKVARRRALMKELQGCLIALIVLVSVSGILLIAYRQSASHELLVSTHKGVNNTQDILNFVKDCTQPEGKCYKQGLANQLSQQEKVEEIVVLAAACAKQQDNVTFLQIKACVEAGLK